MTFQEILDNDFNIDELEKEIKSKINNGEFLSKL